MPLPLSAYKRDIPDLVRINIPFIGVKQLSTVYSPLNQKHIRLDLFLQGQQTPKLSSNLLRKYLGTHTVIYHFTVKGNIL